MTQTELNKTIKSLPEDQLKSLISFINNLLSKKEATSVKKKKKERVFGYAKDSVKLADDFDAPLDEFKDYM